MFKWSSSSATAATTAAPPPTMQLREVDRQVSAGDSIGGGGVTSGKYSPSRIKAVARDWSPRRIRMPSMSSSPNAAAAMPPLDLNEDAAITPAMFLLECAVRKRELFVLLMQLLPTQQAENRLRLLCAALDYLKSDEPITSKRARARKIHSLYLLQGASFEVNDLPTHVLKLETDECMECLKNVVLSDLVQLPEVAAALKAEAAPETSEDEKEQLKELYCKQALSIPHLGSLVEELAMIGKLERVIAKPQTRRMLVQSTLLASVAESWGDVGVRIRFVAAVDQFLGFNGGDEATRNRLGHKISQLFIHPGGMFSLDLGDDRVASAILHGNLGALENARVRVLKQLAASHQVADAVTRLLRQLDAEQEEEEEAEEEDKKEEA